MKSGNGRGSLGAVTAPPGSGKSYISLFLTFLLFKGYNNRDFIISLLKKQTHGSSVIKETEDYLNSSDSMLPVPVVGYDKPLRVSIIESIFLSAESLLDNETCRQLYNLVFQASPPDKNNYAEAAAKLLKNTNFFEIYSNILQFLSKAGITGILLVHDEFNRFLSRQSSDFSDDLDFIQEFAEFNIRIKKFKVIHLLLLHKGISQYLAGINEDRRKDWLKIEGRFTEIHYEEEFTDTLNLLISFFRHYQGRKTPEQGIKKHRESVKFILKHSPLLSAYSEADLIQLGNLAWPLDLTAVIAIPFLNTHFGQGQRTLYSWISEVIQDRDSDVRIKDLFDFFDTRIDKLSFDDRRLAKWIHGRNAVNELRNNENLAAIIKTLTVLDITESAGILPPVRDILALCTGLSLKKTDLYLQELLDRNLIIFRESSGHYSVHFGSSVPIRKILETQSSSVTVSMQQQILLTDFAAAAIYAKNYNAEYFTSRFYTPVYLLEETVINELRATDDLWKSDDSVKPDPIPAVISFLKKLYSEFRLTGSSGIIIYYLGNPDSETAKILLEATAHSKELTFCIFIIANSSFVYSDILKKYCAAKTLSQNAEFLRKDPAILTDLQIHLSDLTLHLKDALKQHFDSDGIHITFNSSFNDNADRENGLLSQILKKRFPDTIKVNSELINRENISPNIRNARKKILRDILSGSEFLGTKEKGYGPDIAVFRALFTSKNLYSNGKFLFGKAIDTAGSPDTGAGKVIKKIQEYLLKHSDKHSFSLLYRTLLKEPFGLYSEIIPVYIVAVLTEGGYSYSLYCNGRYEKEINSDTFERLHLDPDSFRIRILKKDVNKDKFIGDIITVFKNPGVFSGFRSSEPSVTSVSRTDSENKIYEATLAILMWYNQLPEYTKNSAKRSEKLDALLRTIAAASDPQDLLFESIPQIFAFDWEKADSENTSILIDNIIFLKQEADSFYLQLVLDISALTLKAVFPYIKKSYNNLTDAIADFRSSNESLINELKVRDPDFAKLNDRLLIPYKDDSVLIESIGSVLTGSHPRYWKDETIKQYEFRLTSELAKLHIASLMGGDTTQANYLKIQQILKAARNFSKEERELLIQELVR